MSEAGYKSRFTFGEDYGTSFYKFGPITCGERPEVVENRGYFPDESMIMFQLMGRPREVVIGDEIAQFLGAREELIERLVYPMRNGVIDRDDERAWRIVEELTRYGLERFRPKAEPNFNGFYVCASLSAVSPRYMYERLFDIHEHIGEGTGLVKAVTIIPQPLAVAIAHKTPTCVVVESGHGNSVPYEEPVLLLIKGLLTVMPIGEFVDTCLGDGALKDGDVEYRDLSALGIQALTFDPTTLKVEFKPIRTVYRHKSPGKLFKVRTRSGREITVTADHNIFTLRGGRLVLLPTTQLKLGDYIPVPRRIPEPVMNDVDCTGEHVMDILEYYGYPHWIYVKPDGQLRELIAKHGRDGGVKEILGPSRISGIVLYGESIRADRFLKLARYLNIDLRRTFMVKGRGRSKPIPSKVPIDKAFLKAGGVFLAEGGRHGRNSMVMQVTRTGCRELDDCVKRFIEKLATTTPIGRYGAYVVNNKLLSKLFFDLLGADAGQKRIPALIMGLPLKKLAIFLRAYFEGDGYAPQQKGTKINNVVGATTKSKRLAHDLMIALHRFGIVARARTRVARSKNQEGVYYEVYISGSENLTAFEKHIGFFSGRKQSALRALIRTPNANVDVVPCGKFLREARTRAGISSSDISEISGVHQRQVLMYEEERMNPSRPKLQELAEAYGQVSSEDDAKWIYALAQGDIFWDEITSIRDVDPSSDFVYDISCPGNETFFAGFGGIFVHNTQLCPISRYPIRRAIVALNRGGGDADAITSQILYDAGYGDLAKEEAIVRQVKEALGLVPRDLDDAIRMAKAGKERFRAAHRIPGTRMSIDLGDESWTRFLIGEYVFNPKHEIFQSYFSRGMPKPKDVKIGDVLFRGMLDFGEAIIEAIEKCPIELQPYLYRKVLLSGGNFQWRVPAGLEDAAVDSVTKMRVLLKEKGLEDISVEMAGEPKFSVWRGCIIYGYAVPSRFEWSWETMEGWMKLRP